MNRSLSKSLMMVALFGLSLASAMAAKQEFYAGKSSEDMAFSLLSDYRILSNCLAGLTTLQGRLLRGENRRLALQKCDSTAQAILETSPHDAYAWYISAYANFHLGNAGRFNETLGKSYEFAPFETWLSRLRIPLAERALTTLTKANTTRHADDLNLILTSNTGFSLLVSHYIQNPDFRVRISTLLANHPTAIQTRFLAALRRNISEQINGN